MLRERRGFHHSLVIRDRERHWVVGALYAAAAAAVIGAGVSTYSAVQQSEQNASMAKAAQRQREKEAAIASDNAAFEERQHRRRISLLLGQQQAVYAAAGVDPTSGSPLLQQIDTIKQGEIEALGIRSGGSIDSSERMFEAGMAKYQVRAFKAQIPLQIASGVASATYGAASAYSKFGTTRTPRKSVIGSWSGGYSADEL